MFSLPPLCTKNATAMLKLTVITVIDVFDCQNPKKMRDTHKIVAIENAAKFFFVFCLFWRISLSKENHERTYNLSKLSKPWVSSPEIKPLQKP